MNQMHIEGCSTPHETCVEIPPEAEDAGATCHVFGESSEYTIAEAMDDWNEPPAGTYEIWLICQCHCSYASIGEVNRNGKLTAGRFQSRSAAYQWAIRRFPARNFMVLARKERKPLA